MATLKEEIEAIKGLQDGIVKNKVANFAYTDEAYTKNNADGVEIYDVNQSQNIPVPNPDVLKVNPTVLTKGYRAQASSVTRMLMNHFFGRTSYNLNKVNDFFLSLLTKLSAYLGTANGIATLDSNVKVPVEQLQNIIDDSPVGVTTPTNKTYSISKIREIVTQQAEELSNSIREVLEQLNSFINTKGKANGIASLDGNARVPLTQLQNVIDTKGKANGIASLDSNAKVPVEQLQNIINDASASGNKTYSSNKIDTMNTNLNNKIDSISNRKIWVHNLYWSGKCSTTPSSNKIRSFYIAPFNIYSTDSEPIDTEEKLIAYIKNIECPVGRSHGISVTGWVRDFDENVPNQNIFEMCVTKEDNLNILAISENTYNDYYLKSIDISDKVMLL